MKLLLKSDVGIAAGRRGVYVQAGQRGFLIEGERLFPLVERVLARFDGRTPVAAIEQALPEAARPLLSRMVTELTRHRMVQQVLERTVDPVPPSLARLHAQTLAFLRDETSDADAAFRAWRSTEIIVAGSGCCFEALVLGLLHSGAARLRLVLEFDAAQAESIAFLRAQIAAQAALDAELDVRWLTPVSASSALQGFRGRVLYAADEYPRPGASSILHALLDCGASPVLLGGIYRGHGLVGPERESGHAGMPADWTRLETAAPAQGHADSDMRVIGSLMAFETLRAVAAASDTPARRGWLREHLLRISPGSEITSHTCSGATIPDPAPHEPAVQPPRGRSVEEDRIARRRALEGAMEAAFDPFTGVLAWEDDIAAEFPLPHRVLRVRADDAAPATLVVQWGLTPQDAALRTICAAVRTCAERDRGRGAHAFVATLADDAWEALSLAHAVVESKSFAAQASAHRVSVAEIGHPDVQMLARLTRLYTGQLPELFVHLLPGVPAFVVHSHAAPSRQRGVGATLIEAVIESLGGLVSGLQRGLSEASSQPVPKTASPEAVTPWTELQHAATSAQGAGHSLGWRPVHHRMQLPLLTHAPITVGWTELIATEGA